MIDQQKVNTLHLEVNIYTRACTWLTLINQTHIWVHLSFFSSEYYFFTLAPEHLVGPREKK
jgi:hypothetical protein